MKKLFFTHFDRIAHVYGGSMCCPCATVCGGPFVVSAEKKKQDQLVGAK